MVAKPRPVTKVMRPMALATGMRPDILREGGGGREATNAKRAE